MAREALEWKTIEDTDIRKLGKPIATSYATWVKAMDDAETAKEAFTKLMNEELINRKVTPAGKVAVFGHRFGKLGIAFASVSKKSPSTFSFGK